ncbi:MAG TPA: ABC transporter permease subunit [Gemmataceae bacterium]|jgi:ABC-type transport system involved in multi-copper enzyme maturation permease subunit
MNPIIRRELLEVLRTRKVVALQLGLALACALLVLTRWPTEGTVDMGGVRSQQVVRVFGYGLLAAILLLVPAYPATTLVREKMRGTLALLLNSPMSPWSIYVGKLGGVLAFTLILLVMTAPAAAACHALGGGTTARGGIPGLYGVLFVAAVQLSTLALLVSCRARSTDSALRTTYALVLVVCVLTLAPHELLRGRSDALAQLASWLRCLSPVPAVMELLGQGDVGSHGMLDRDDVIGRYLVLASLASLICAVATVVRLNHKLLDLARPSGVMTQDRSTWGQVARHLIFLVDPQRRSGSMSLWVNPVMVKEFRSRRFGRSHWTLRLIAVCAILSLGLSYIAASGILGWGVDIIGGALVLLQIALLILFAPSLAAGLVSAERESGSWQLLRITPLSPGKILRGKLLSVAWPLLLLLCATLPGYIAMIAARPALIHQVQRVVICLAVTGVFAVLVSAAASTLFRSTATATTASYLALLAVCVAPLLVWLGREAPFGHTTVRAALLINPVAAALQAADTPGFVSYELLPINWWIIGSACMVLLIFLGARTWQLYRPE